MRILPQYCEFPIECTALVEPCSNVFILLIRFLTISIIMIEYNTHMDLKDGTETQQFEVSVGSVGNRR